MSIIQKLTHRFLIVHTAVLLTVPSPASAGVEKKEEKMTSEQQISTAAMGNIIILSGGRKKPLDTYAIQKLVQFSGKKRYKGMPAVQWLSRLLFDPQSTINDKIFLINNPEIADALGVSPEKRRLYSFKQLKMGHHRLKELSIKAAMTPAKERSVFETEIIRTANNVRDYLMFSGVLSALLPHPDFKIYDPEVKAYLKLNPASSEFSYYELSSRSPLLSAAISEIQKKDRKEWRSFENSIIRTAHVMYRWTQTESNQEFEIIPVFTESREEWLSPWDAIARAGTRIESMPEIIALFSMLEAYIRDDQPAFDKSLEAFNTAVRETVSSNNGKLKNPGMELLYNKTSPFSKAKIIYGICAILALSLVTITWKRWLYICTFLFVLTGFLPHTFGIIARMIITGHPPVATFYETFIFVAWAAVLLGFILEIIQKNALGLFISSVSGFVFLHIAGKYSMDGDTMGMLAAVLNSTFWLTTHIVTIALGYTGCCCAGIMGHIYLIQLIYLRADSQRLSSIERALYGTLAFGLICTVGGTLLGGMWADQSWGRFWGWDPKENGALLIILWCAIIFHAKAGKIIGEEGTAVGSILGLMLVMFAWIGVNLLGVGLHSYGFTTSGANILFSLVFFEISFLVITGIVKLAKKRT